MGEGGGGGKPVGLGATNRMGGPIGWGDPMGEGGGGKPVGMGVRWSQWTTWEGFKTGLTHNGGHTMDGQWNSEPAAYQLKLVH